MSKWLKVSAIVIAIIGVLILAYAVLTPEPTSDTDNHMGGMMGGRATYSSLNVGLIALSSAMIVIALMVVFLREEYEPLPLPVSPPRGSQAETKEVTSPEEVDRPSVDAHYEHRAFGADETASRNYLVLRLLTGDERTMFKAVMDSGGEALQKDLILRTRMSNAKVTRLLSRLEEKGVISKERYGATNRISIKPEP